MTIKLLYFIGNFAYDEKLLLQRTKFTCLNIKDLTSSSTCIERSDRISYKKSGRNYLLKRLVVANRGPKA